MMYDPFSVIVCALQDHGLGTSKGLEAWLDFGLGGYLDS